MEQTSSIFLMPQAVAGWSRLAPEQRRNLLVAAGRALRKAWDAGIDVRLLPLNSLAFEPQEPRAIAPRLPDALRLPHPVPRHLLEALSAWSEELLRFAGSADLRDLARALFPELATDLADFHASRAARNALRRRRERTRAVYTGFLRSGGERPANGIRGHWAADPFGSLLDLHAELSAAEESTDTRRLKSTPTLAIFRAVLRGQDVLIKKHTLPESGHRITYRWRPSRANRAWAAANTLRECEIPTPDPLGFLEVIENRVPTVGYVITAWKGSAQTAYRWIKHVYRHLPLDERRQALRECAATLIALYRDGIRHRDTKLMNLLVEEAPSGARCWSWIDLESVETGRRITRRDVLRNLIQLNGSARHWITEEDRLFFLTLIAREFPELDQRDTVALIRERTRARLLRELRGETAADGVSRS